MAGPWERYAQPTVQAGPWTKYAAPEAPSAADLPVPEAPPGAVVHDVGRSYAAADPSISVARPSNDGSQNGVEMAALAARAASPNVEALAKWLTPVAQGLTFGAGDELISAIYGLGQAARGAGFTEPFNVAQEVQRQNLSRTQTQHPIATPVAEILGGIATGAGLAKQGISSAGLLSRNLPEAYATALPARIAGGTAEGASLAGIYGFNSASGGVEDRVRQAKDNAMFGSLFGAAAPVAADVIGGLWGIGRNALQAARNPTGRADELLAKAIMRDAKTPEGIASAVEAAQAAGQPSYLAVDAGGRNTQRMAKMAAMTPGEFRNTSAEAMAARQMGQGQRVGAIIEDALGPGNAYQTEQNLLAQRRAGAQSAYEAAYAAPPPAGQFYDDLMQKPIVQKAIASMRSAAENSVDGMKSPVDMADMVVAGAPGTEGVGGAVQGLSTRGWDYVKRFLDTTVDSLYNGSAEDKALAPVYRDLRDALKQRLATDNPDYGRALQQFADDTASLEAIDVGRQLAKRGNPDEARAAFGALTPEQRDLARIGLVRDTRARLENAAPGVDKTRMLDNPATDMTLGMAVEDPVARAAMSERLARERDMVRTNRMVQGGSNSYENLLEGADVGNVGGALAALFSGHPARAAGLFGGQVAGHIARTAAGMNEPTAARIGEYLMSNDPERIRQLAAVFAQMQAAQAAPEVAPFAASSGFNAFRSGQDARKR